MKTRWFQDIGSTSGTKKSIHLSELKEMIPDCDAAIIDTRPWDSYRQGHIKGTLFHPFNRSFVTDVGSLVARILKSV